MILELGTIIRWDNFPFPKYGREKKPRWFICIGFSGPFAQVAEIYLCTTTTQIQKFQGSGNRKNHDCFIFTINQFSEFEQDCALDFEEHLYVVTEDRLKLNQANLDLKGRLQENTMRMIYNRYLRSNHISKAVLNDIHNSYNMTNISGLKKPK